MASMGGFLYLSSTEKQPQEKVAYRVLGKTGIRMPVITMGVMNTDNPNLVRAALNAGMFHLDTAQTYQRGTNEAMIGEVLKGRPRDSFAISTKARLPNDRNTGLYLAEATEEAYTKKIDTSLKNLGLDYIDIYHHHNVWRRESAFYEPIMKALEKAKKAGKIRFIGITTHRNEPEVIRAAIDSKVYDVVLTAYNFRQQHGPEVKKAIAQAAEAGLGVVAMKTIGGNIRGSYASETIDARAALKWALQDPNVHTIIAGFTTFDQMNLDLAVMKDFALTQSEKNHLRRAKLFSGLYCQGCGQCLGQCLKQLPIPDLMRAYMYVYGYRNLVEAQDLLFSLNLPSEFCGDCSSCPVKCLNRWNVSARIQDVVHLREVPSNFIA
ncbi:MAG: aldo/keto reductase [Proteobacteria bacterium]|nr:aldo/keto reductase [Pseudomonadota bacterium]